MILTVTVNAAVDKTLTVANLQLGRRHRAQQGLAMPGGKGINVARALRRLGEPVIATGLADSFLGPVSSSRDLPLGTTYLRCRVRLVSMASGRSSINSSTGSVWKETTTQSASGTTA